MNKTRVEILLINAIDLLLQQGFDYDKIQQELGLSDKERKEYLDEAFK